MIFEQLFDTKSSTYTYIISSGKGREALIIDPVIENTEDYIKVLNNFIIELQCKVSSLTDQVTICPMPFILFCLGKFKRIAKLANSCKPSVNALKTAIVFAIS